METAGIRERRASYAYRVVFAAVVVLLAVACCFKLTDVCRQLRMYAGLANQVEHLTSQMNTVEAEIDAAKASVKQLADKLNRLPLHRLSGESQGNSGGEP